MIYKSLIHQQSISAWLWLKIWCLRHPLMHDAFEEVSCNKLWNPLFRLWLAWINSLGFDKSQSRCSRDSSKLQIVKILFEKTFQLFKKFKMRLIQVDAFVLKYLIWVLFSQLNIYLNMRIWDILSCNLDCLEMSLLQNQSKWATP